MRKLTFPSLLELAASHLLSTPKRTGGYIGLGLSSFYAALVTRCLSGSPCRPPQCDWPSSSSTRHAPISMKSRFKKKVDVRQLGTCCRRLHQTKSHSRWCCQLPSGPRHKDSGGNCVKSMHALGPLHHHLNSIISTITLLLGPREPPNQRHTRP